MCVNSFPFPWNTKKPLNFRILLKNGSFQKLKPPKKVVWIFEKQLYTTLWLYSIRVLMTSICWCGSNFSIFHMNRHLLDTTANKQTKKTKCKYTSIGMPSANDVHCTRAYTKKLGETGGRKARNEYKFRVQVRKTKELNQFVVLNT